MGRRTVWTKVLQLLLIGLLLLTLLPWEALAVEAQQTRKTVRVAYVLTDNFQEGGDGEHKYGYGYEYLQKIAYYTGWEYEYVYGTFQDCLNQLMAGEVDLMTDVPYTEIRAEKILYSALPQGEDVYYLYGREGNTTLDPQDLSTFRDAKIGISAGSHQIDLFTSWCAEQDLYCGISLYTSEEKMMEDLANGVLDGAMDTDTYGSGNIQPLLQIGQMSYYFAVSQSQPDLLQELDEAMRRILAADPSYADELKIKYLTGSAASVPTLSDGEQAWLDQTSVVRVGLLDDYLPYCTYNEETGQPEGMVVDLLDNIAAGFDFQYEAISYQSYQALQDALDDGTVDAIFPIYGDYGVGEYKDLMISDATTTTTMTIFNGESIAKDRYSAAITATDPFQMAYVTLHYPDVELTILDTVEDCVQAVLNDKVDFTVVETAAANKLLKTVNTNHIQVANFQDLVNVSFAVGYGSVDLLSILNKGILMTDDSLIVNSLVYHAQLDTKQSIWEFMQAHMLAVILSMLAVFGVILALTVAYFTQHQRSRKRLCAAESAVQKERWRAEHDPLTGLMNRSAFSLLSEALRGKAVPVALVILDVDNFKSINDTYGHDVGDQALQRVGNALRHTFRANDHIIRYAGDEFVILMVEMTVDLADVVGAKLDHINNVLRDPADPVPSMSLSAGVAFSTDGYDDSLFLQADQALYQTKEHGRCGYTIER